MVCKGFTSLREPRQPDIQSWRNGHYIPPIQCSLTTCFMRLTWVPFQADRTQVGPILALWTLLSGLFCPIWNEMFCLFVAQIRSLRNGHYEPPMLWSLIARFTGLTWGPSEADRTRVGPMLAPWTLLFGLFSPMWDEMLCFFCWPNSVEVPVILDFVTIEHLRRQKPSAPKM